MDLEKRQTVVPIVLFAVLFLAYIITSAVFAQSHSITIDATDTVKIPLEHDTASSPKDRESDALTLTCQADMDTYEHTPHQNARR